MVLTPRVRLPNGLVRLVEPERAGRLKGFTVFEALVLTLAREMTFAAIAPLAGKSWHRVAAICKRYVRLAADAKRRAVLFVADGEDALAVVREHHGSKVEPLKQVARMISKLFYGIITWARTPQTNGFFGGSQWPVSIGQASGAWLRELRDHPDRDLPERGQTGFFENQSSSGCPLTHSIFERVFFKSSAALLTMVPGFAGVITHVMETNPHLPVGLLPGPNHTGRADGKPNGRGADIGRTTPFADKTG